MVVIRNELKGDIPAIHSLLAGSFETEAEAKLVDALRNGGRLAISLVAEYQGMVAGHIAFSPVVVSGAADGLGLAPLAVAAPMRNRGIGARLVNEGLAAARRMGAGFAVVLGDPAYYLRFGFEPAGDWGLLDAYGGGAAFQAIELRPGAIPRGAGLARYAPEFAVFEGG